MVALTRVGLPTAIPWCDARADRGRRSERLLRGRLTRGAGWGGPGGRYKRIPGRRGRVPPCGGHAGFPHRSRGPFLRSCGSPLVVAAALPCRYRRRRIPSRSRHQPVRSRLSQGCLRRRLQRVQRARRAWHPAGRLAPTTRRRPGRRGRHRHRSLRAPDRRRRGEARLGDPGAGGPDRGGRGGVHCRGHRSAARSGCRDCGRNMTGPAEQTLLAAVERSPQAAAAHDRTGWVDLFTVDGRVQDPVGSRPHAGPVEIGRFYDTFIGPRNIAFHRDLDIVRGSSVIRDLDLEVAMGSAVTMTIPAFLRYDLREVEGDWKVVTLRAYWELPAMVLQFLRNGASAVPATVQLSRGLIRNQRLRGTAGFVAGFRRVGSRQKALVDTFVNAVGRGDRFGALQALSSGATITFGDDEKADVAELIERCSGATAAKLIAAGSTVAASVTSGKRRGVLFADGARRGPGIHRVRYFPQ